SVLAGSSWVLRAETFCVRVSRRAVRAAEAVQRFLNAEAEKVGTRQAGDALVVGDRKVVVDVRERTGPRRERAVEHAGHAPDLRIVFVQRRVVAEGRRALEGEGAVE